MVKIKNLTSKKDREKIKRLLALENVLIKKNLIKKEDVDEELK